MNQEPEGVFSYSILQKNNFHNLNLMKKNREFRSNTKFPARKLIFTKFKFGEKINKTKINRFS